MKIKLAFCFGFVGLTGFGADLVAPNLVRGRVEGVERHSAMLDVATVVIDEVFHGQRSLVGNRFTVWTAESRPETFGWTHVVVPKLRIGELGIWAIQAVPAKGLSSISYPIHGKMWPVIRGRDDDYDKLVLWAGGFAGVYLERDVPGLESSPGARDGIPRAFSPTEQVAFLKSQVSGYDASKRGYLSDVSPLIWVFVGAMVLLLGGILVFRRTRR